MTAAAKALAARGLSPDSRFCRILREDLDQLVSQARVLGGLDRLDKITKSQGQDQAETLQATLRRLEAIERSVRGYIQTVREGRG